MGTSCSRSAAHVPRDEDPSGEAWEEAAPKDLKHATAVEKDEEVEEEEVAAKTVPVTSEETMEQKQQQQQHGKVEKETERQDVSVRDATGKEQHDMSMVDAGGAEPEGKAQVAAADDVTDDGNETATESDEEENSHKPSDATDADAENDDETKATAGAAAADPPAADASASEQNKRYRVVKKLGQGAYSKVYLAEMTDGGGKVAIKAVAKARLKKKELASILRETEILASLRHPNVITYIEHFEDADKLYIVTEFAEGGELFERVVEREFYAEADVRTIMIKLLKTVQFCHERGVVHRDIKPENILLASKDDDAEIRLADFGFAKQIEEDSFTNLQTACGTPGYVAPEVISRKPYDASCDVWSLGVVAYILLCGYPPFRGTDRRALFHKIRHANYEFDSPWWDPVSDDAKNFVSCMLVADPEARSKIPALLKHPFLVSSAHVDISASLQPMREWNAKRKVALLRNTWQAMLRFKVFGGTSARKSLSEGSLKEVESSGPSPAPAPQSDAPDANEEARAEHEETTSAHKKEVDAVPAKQTPFDGDENHNNAQDAAATPSDDHAAASLRTV